MVCCTARIYFRIHIRCGSKRTNVRCDHICRCHVQAAHTDLDPAQNFQIISLIHSLTLWHPQSLWCHWCQEKPISMRTAVVGATSSDIIVVLRLKVPIQNFQSRWDQMPLLRICIWSHHGYSSELELSSIAQLKWYKKPGSPTSVRMCSDGQ